MAYAIGIVLALGVGVFGRFAGFDRERAFYSTVAVVVASYYVLFAAMSGSTDALLAESTLMAAFVLAAAIGFRSNLWLVAICLAGHGVLDSTHDFVASNSGVPQWWPPFCASFDVVAAGFLAWLLASTKVAASRHIAEKLAVLAQASSAPES